MNSTSDYIIGFKNYPHRSAILGVKRIIHGSLPVKKRLSFTVTLFRSDQIEAVLQL
jgi:hypothetical protein